MSLGPKSNGKINLESFNREPYIEHNYTTILPEDSWIMRRIAQRLQDLNVQRRSAHRSLSVCHGGIFVFDSVLQDFMADDSQYDLVEYAERNVQAMRVEVQEILAGRKGLWGKYEDLAASISPNYANGLTRACRLGDVVHGSIYDLPPDTYELAATFFGPESITGVRNEFVQAVNCFLNSAKSGAFVVMAFMRGSKSFKTAGPTLPTVRIECSNVRNIFVGQVRDLIVEEVDAPRGARPDNDGAPYRGMGLATGIKI